MNFCLKHPAKPCHDALAVGQPLLLAQRFAGLFWISRHSYDAANINKDPV